MPKAPPAHNCIQCHQALKWTDEPNQDGTKAFKSWTCHNNVVCGNESLMMSKEKLTPRWKCDTCEEEWCEHCGTTYEEPAQFRMRCRRAKERLQSLSMTASSHEEPQQMEVRPTNDNVVEETLQSGIDTDMTSETTSEE